MRIIIVDDSESRRAKLIEHLKSSGEYQGEFFFEADCLDRAREALKREYFDVMVLDVVIPKRSGGKGDAALGIELLKVVSTSNRYKCPEKIIGITAHLDDISSFRAAFLQYCVAVIEARADKYAWREQVLQAINRTHFSKRSRAQTGDVTHQALTIHGIQTFGAWQRRFRIIARNSLGRGNFFTYRYGVFSIISFFIPLLRNREVARLKRELERIFPKLNGGKIAVFCHSFGTFLAVNAIRALLQDGKSVPIHTLVLAGSVLRSNTDLTLLESSGIRLVNDCADHDYVLYLSQAFVLGTGMAGKCGFYGSDNELRTNRFFLGGHSSYFEGDDFMTKHWVPLLVPDSPVGEIDLRTHSAFRHNVLDRALMLLGYLKPLWYLGLASLVLWIILVRFI